MAIRRRCAGATTTPVVVGENKQLSQFYCPVKGEVTQINHVNVSLNDVSCICSFTSTGDVTVCTESDRGVFLLSSRDLRIVKRWRTAIRSSVLKCVSDAGSVLYMCGDDNEVLTLNTGGKEEKDSALKERHSLNVRQSQPRDRPVLGARGGKGGAVRAGRKRRSGRDCAARGVLLRETETEEWK